MNSKQKDKKLSTVNEIKLTSLTRIPKPDLHPILHYFFLQQIKVKETGMPLPSFFNGRHRYFLFTCYKSLNTVNLLKGAALSLMKRQFIKKPRNPE